MDKQLSLGKKIAADLRGVGSALLTKNDLPGAIGFYRRALEVSRNRGDFGLAAEDLARLASIHRQNGEPLLAEQMDADREKILAKGAATRRSQ